MVYLWRAVDAEGEVLDVLVQSKRNKHAALKLMRKLLKKYAFAPERLVTDHLRSYSAAARELGIEPRHERDGRTIELRIRMSRRGGGNARCSGSRARGQPRNFFPPTPPSTTPSTLNVTSSPPPPTACFALTPLHVADRSRSGLTITEADFPRAPKFRALSPRRARKIAEILALRGYIDSLAEFSHSLGGFQTSPARAVKAWLAQFRTFAAFPQSGGSCAGVVTLACRERERLPVRVFTQPAP
jgi:hypothetical protein